MDRSEAAGWLDRYIEAWMSYDPAAIGALFSDDVEYRYYPNDDPLRGRDAVVASWLEDRDDPGTFDAHYEPVAIDGDVVVATGTSTYRSGDGAVHRIYDNCFVMRFDASGRCRWFSEWYVKRRR